MSIVQVNLGQYPNDGAGDDLRTAFEKANANFDELDRTRVIFAQNLGDGAPIFLDKVGNNLRFRSIRSDNSNATLGFDSEEIILTVQDSINGLIEDPNPRLGGNLNLNGFDILGSGNISINGNVTANEVIGTFNGSFNGEFNGTLIGNVLVNDGNILIQAIDSNTNNYNAVSVNGLTISGSNVFEPGTTTLSTFVGDGLVIFSDNQLVLNSPNGVLIDTDLTVPEAVINELNSTTALITDLTVTEAVINELNSTTALITDLTVTNEINGTISSIGNHNLSDLSDVSALAPANGQALVWNGTQWSPGDVATSGQEINTFDLGNFRRVFTNPLVYLLDRVGIDFGTFTEPSNFTIDLETF
jgi:hypothetical protein